MKTIPNSHIGLLESNQIVVLSTIGPAGEPQTTALWFLYEDGELKMSINETRQKMKNLRQDPRASALLIDPANPYRTLELRGHVTVEDDSNYEFADRAGQKYNANMREMDKPGEVRAQVTLVVEKVNAFGE